MFRFLEINQITFVLCIKPCKKLVKIFLILLLSLLILLTLYPKIKEEAMEFRESREFFAQTNIHIWKILI